MMWWLWLWENHIRTHTHTNTMLRRRKHAALRLLPVHFWALREWRRSLCTYYRSCSRSCVCACLPWTTGLLAQSLLACLFACLLASSPARRGWRPPWPWPRRAQPWRPSGRGRTRAAGRRRRAAWRRLPVLACVGGGREAKGRQQQGSGPGKKGKVRLDSDSACEVEGHGVRRKKKARG